MGTGRRLLGLLGLLAETVLAETATVRVRLRVASGEVDKDPALPRATTVVRDRASVRVRPPAIRAAPRGETTAVRRALFRLARATVATVLRETASATKARAQVVNGARASVVAPTASVLVAATEASVLPEVATEDSVRPRARDLRPARKTADLVLRTTLRTTHPTAVPSVRGATARRAGPMIVRTITIAPRARALPTRVKLRLRATCRASLPRSRGRRFDES